MSNYLTPRLGKAATQAWVNVAIGDAIIEAGAGDMVGANNLTDVASASTSLSNLGGATTGHNHSGDYQPLDSVLTNTTASYTTAEALKLNGIDSYATIDQTGAEIKTAYEAEDDTNAFTDTDVTNLGNQSGTNSGDNSANTTYADDYRVANFVADTDYASALGVDDNYVTDDEKTVIGNTSGENTGDQTIPVTGVDFDPVGTDNSTPVTVADTAEIDMTLTGQEVKADIVASSIDETKLDVSVNASLDLADSSSQATGVANNADVTGTTNVTNAGAVMDTELINTTTGVPDAGKPIKLDTAGVIDSTMYTDTDSEHDAIKIQGADVDSTVGTPSDGDIMVYRDAGTDFVLEAKPASGSNPALNDITDVIISSVSDNEFLAYDNGTSKWINQTASDTGVQPVLAEGAFADGDKTKLDTIDDSADVTGTTNVTDAGALMDSEVTNLAQVKAFDTTDYATSTQGGTADTAMQDFSDDASPTAGGILAMGSHAITTSANIDGVDVGTDVPLNTTHRGLTNNPHSVDAGDVSLGNVDNTSDATKDAAEATLTNKTLTTPTIGSMTNAQHDHEDAAGGGKIDQLAITNPYCFSAYNSSATTVPNVSETHIAFQTETYDLNSNFASNQYTAPVDGIYHFDATVSFAGAAAGAGSMFLILKVNGGGVRRGGRYHPEDYYGVSVSADIQISSEDTVRIYMYQSSGASETTGTGQLSSWFSGHLVHAT